MSWHARADVEGPEGLSAVPFSPQVGHGEAESKEAFGTALQLAAGLMNSGHVGSGPYTVELAGHANPGFSHADGWSPDSIYVRVTARKAEVPA